MRVVVTGASGMVGKAVAEHCADKGDVVLAYDHQGLDITESALVLHTIQSENPDIVINCAAWTDVDGCEFNSPKAFAVNAAGTENLALACRNVGACFITISTDYVFDGSKSGFYTQADQPNPQSIYARSKLEGERRANAAYSSTIVVRTGFVFGPGGKNFLSTLMARAKLGHRIVAIGDAYGTPTYSRDLAARLHELAERNVPNIYHVVNGGDGASFEEFAREAIKICSCAEIELESVPMDSLHRPAMRPRNSRLQCLYSEDIGLRRLRSWQSALADFARLESETFVANFH